MKIATGILAVLMIGSLALPQSRAATVPFIEDFTSSVSNWADNSGINLLNHIPSGGPDAGSYASTNKSLLNLADQSVVLFRAQDEFNSSGHAFEGNWIAENVGEFSAYVRHNAPMPLTYFTRFSGPGNFPGGVAVKFSPVLANTWTQLRFSINPFNPEFVTFEGTSFQSVFANVGHIQIGVRVPAALGADPSELTFDLDKASIAAVVPEPTSLLLAAAAGFLGLARLRQAVR